MQKLTNRDIKRIVKQWKKNKPIKEIANYFEITRQWVHNIINRYIESGEIPVLHKPGRKQQDVPEEIRVLILESFHAYTIGPVHLEKKIEEVHGQHIPHNTIYRVLLNHGCIEVNMKKRKQRKWVFFLFRRVREFCVVVDGTKIPKISNLTDDLRKILALLGLPYKKYYF